MLAHVEAMRKQYPAARVVLWASLECTNFSIAKGGQSRDADSRTLAEHLFRYIDALRPDYIQIENVKEFMTWGPLVVKVVEAYRTISGCILLEAPQRSYNIVLSLCRIISSLNGRISGRYDFNPAKPLVRIPALLECTGIEDCKIDGIIELNLTD